jgi:uncharacterized protein (TIGR03437 family)
VRIASDHSAFRSVQTRLTVQLLTLINQLLVPKARRLTGVLTVFLTVILIDAGNSALVGQSGTVRVKSGGGKVPVQNPPSLNRCSRNRITTDSVCAASSNDQAAGPSFDKWMSSLAGADPTTLTIGPAGQIYIGGVSWSGLPVTANAFQSTYPPGFEHVTGFLVELDPTGSQVLYATYLNGLIPHMAEPDQSGNIYVLADHPEQNADLTAVSYPAPVTANAVQTYPGTVSTPTLLKISADGNLIYATFLGGAIALTGGALAIDSTGSAVVCGSTGDPALPVSPGAFQSAIGGNFDVFIGKVSADGSAYEVLTYLGGDGSERCTGLQIDSTGNIFVYGDTSSRFFPVTPGAYQTTRGAGSDLYVAKLNPSLQQLVWATYIGGDWDSFAQGYVAGAAPGTQALAMAADGSLVFVANTEAQDYPISPDTSPPPFPPAGEPVLGVIDPTGSHLTFSCAFPISGNAGSIATTDGNLFYLTGSATIGEISANATLNAQGLDGLYDLGPIYPYPFLARVDLSARAVTYLGPLTEIAGLNAVPPIGSGVAPDGSLVVASMALGSYASPYPPVKSLGGIPNPGYGTILFDLNFSSEKQPLVTAVVSPASLLASPFTRGDVVEVRGTGLGPSVSVTADDISNLPLNLAGVQVTINDSPVALISVAGNSILAVAPVSGLSGATSMISVIYDGEQSDARAVPNSQVNPAIFTTLGVGAGQANARNADGSVNSSNNPARKGDAISLVVTGLGMMSLTSDESTAPITVSIAGVAAQVSGIEQAAGYPAGYYAISAMIPVGAPQGDYVLVTVEAGDTSSQPGVTISIR